MREKLLRKTLAHLHLVLVDCRLCDTDARTLKNAITVLERQLNEY